MAVTGPNTFFKTTTAPSSIQDLGGRYVSKSYLLDVYPSIASQIGNRTIPGLWGAGNDSSGIFGNNNQINYSSPIQVGSLSDWKNIDTGGLNLSQNVGGLKRDDTIWTWGTNNTGQLGINNTINYSSPVQVGALTDWSSISVNTSTVGAIKKDGTLWVWGYNGLGGLGINNTINYSSPVQVGALTDWKSITCGYSTMFSIKTNGSLWAWGGNVRGELGINDVVVIAYSSPIQVGALTDWASIASGDNEVLAIKTDGTLWAWGRNSLGQLGINNTINYSSPVQVGALTDWKQVSINGTVAPILSAAIKLDGSLWIWGRVLNSYYSSPIQVGSLTNWKQVSCGAINIFAVKTDGTLWGIGNNNYGDLGPTIFAIYNSPIQIGADTTWKFVRSATYSFLGIKDGYI